MSFAHIHTNSDTIPTAVSDANTALAAKVLALFQQPELARMQRIAALQATYGDAFGDQLTILRARQSAKVAENDRRAAAIRPFIVEGSLAPTLDAHGNLVNPLTEAAQNAVSWEFPSLPNEATIKRWTPTSNTLLDLNRCFVGCNTEYNGLALRSTGGAYGVSMDWGKKGICLPSFANPQQYLSWFEADSHLTGLLWAMQQQKLRQRVIMDGFTHRFTLNTDGTSYLLNGRPTAPSEYGSYRYRDQLFAPVTNTANLGPMSLTFLNSLAAYYRHGLAAPMGSYDQTLQGQPSWAILDGQPGTWLEHNVYNNPQYMTTNQQFQSTGTVRMDFSNAARQANVVDPWTFVPTDIFPGYGVDSMSGALVPLKLTAPSASIDPLWASENGIISGDVDILNPAARNPYAVIFAIAPTKMATILTMTEPYAHAAFGENALKMMHSGAGLPLVRPRLAGQIADIIDWQWSTKAIVIPNKSVENASTGILARGQVHAAVPLQMCNLAAVVNVVPDAINDQCARGAEFAGYVTDRITGAPLNRNAFPVGASRLIPNSTTIYNVDIALQPGQTFNVLNPFTTGVNGTVTVTVSDANNVNTERVAATLTRGLNYYPVAGGMQLMPFVELTFASALAAGKVIREVSVPNVVGADLEAYVDVLIGSIENVYDPISDALVTGQLEMQLKELPTPAQWAQGTTKVLTAYNAAGTAVYTLSAGDAVTLTDTDNLMDGQSTRVRLSSSSANFTKALLSVPTITRITLS